MFEGLLAPVCMGTHLSTPITQKATGLRVLKQKYGPGGFGYCHHLAVPYAVVRTMDDIIGEDDADLDDPHGHTAVFARPCPKTPRHGFVDSRTVATCGDLRAVLAETLAADPQGEVMLSSFIEADHSMVITPSLIVAGPGHDGATAGKDTISLPLVWDRDKTVAAWHTPLAQIPADADPYLEAITKGSGVYLAQLRGGPRMTSTHPDWIPEPITVTQVIAPAGEDLLAWEERVAKMTPGTVVYHPGGSLADHYAVHCRTVGIPVITTFEPTVGQVLEPIATVDPDPQAVLDGIILGSAFKLEPTHTGVPHNAVRLLLYGLHHSAALQGSHAKWIGCAAALMLRLGTIAAKGEARHLRPKHASRDAVYNTAWDHSLNRHRMTIRKTINIFRFGAFSGSVGGKKWASCAMAMVPLFDAVGALAKDPTVANVNALLGALNTAVNQAHYNGWWLNKFTEGTGSSTFTTMQDTSGAIRLLYPYSRLATGAYDAHAKARNMTQTERERIIERIKHWVPITLTPPKIDRVEMVTLDPGATSLSLKLYARSLGQYARTLNIPIQSIVENMITRNASSLFFELNPNGKIDVTLRRPHMPTVVVWSEDVPSPQSTK